MVEAPEVHYRTCAHAGHWSLEQWGVLPAGALAALDGVRAVAATSILAGHCMIALGFAWPERHLDWYAALEAHPWMLALVNLPEPAMDTLLILTGFLAAHSLLPALSRGAQSPAQVGA